MERAITTYSSDFLIINYDTPVVTPPFKIQEVNIEVSCKPQFDKEIQLQYIVYNNHFFSFKKPLICNIASKKNLFFITNKELELSVWGNSIQEAIDALHFQFYSLYSNYALDSDQNLSNEAKVLKSKILDLISLVL
jgi:hypothetical protein